jgi:hypothetical protein
MQAHPSDATGVRTPERNAIAAIRDAYEAARAVGFDTNDVVEVIAAARGALPTVGAVFAGAHRLATAAVLANRGWGGPWLVLPLPRLNNARWCYERPADAPGMLVLGVPAPMTGQWCSDGIYDDDSVRDAYENRVREALDAHAARFGPVQALAEYEDIVLPGDDDDPAFFAPDRSGRPHQASHSAS